MSKLQVRRGWAHAYVYGDNPFKLVAKPRKAQCVAHYRDLGVRGLRGGSVR